MGQGFKALALGTLLVTPLVTNAALVDRGGGMIYDDELKITWLQNANLGAGWSGYDDGANPIDGRMTWDSANAWADHLHFGGYDDWRRPTALNSDGTGPCVGLSCAASELGHMFYSNMGATAYQSILSGSSAANLALFSNIQPAAYWSGTEVAPGNNHAWMFSNIGGGQESDGKAQEFHAWAVRDGDVVSPVPLPAAAWLLLSGLAGLGYLGRRRKAA